MIYTNCSSKPFFELNVVTSLLLKWCVFTIFSIGPLHGKTYQVDIDYHHPILSYTDSKSNFTITFLDELGEVVWEETVEGIYPISDRFRSFRVDTGANIQLVKIRIDGEDAFFIDRVTIRMNGLVVQEYGEDGGKGWCLSTDANDGNGKWAPYLEGGCQAFCTFVVSGEINDPVVLGKQQALASAPTHHPSGEEQSWIYGGNEGRKEINAEGLGRCYDIRYVDPINWSAETLKTGLRSSVVDLIRDDSRRPARHNNGDYVVPSGVVFTSEIIGDSEAESRFAATAYEYESEVLQDYRAGIGVPKAGSAKFSAAFKDVSLSQGRQESLYAFSKMYKQFYKLDLYFDDPLYRHYINPRFWQGVVELGQGLSAMAFIEKFGTHYAATTYYGGNFFQRRSVHKSEFSHYESSEREFKVDVEGTIKKVNFSLGTTQGQRNGSGQTEQVELSSAKIFTVGGDLNQYRPDLWAHSVLKNPAVVKIRLTRISDLLIPENFPELPNIREKQRLLKAAIMVAEEEAKSNQSPKQDHAFFTKSPATFRLTVTHMKCKGHGAKEPGGNSEYFGSIKMAMFNRASKMMKSKTCFQRSDKKAIDLAINQTRDINRSITYQVTPADIQKGYISVYGNLKEKDLATIQLSTVSQHATNTRIYYRNALDHEVRKKVVFTSKHGDRVEVHYKLERMAVD